MFTDTFDTTFPAFRLEQQIYAIEQQLKRSDSEYKTENQRQEAKLALNNYQNRLAEMIKREPGCVEREREAITRGWEEVTAKRPDTSAGEAEIRRLEKEVADMPVLNDIGVYLKAQLIFTAVVGLLGVLAAYISYAGLAHRCESLPRWTFSWTKSAFILIALGTVTWPYWTRIESFNDRVVLLAGLGSIWLIGACFHTDALRLYIVQESDRRKLAEREEKRRKDEQQSRREREKNERLELKVRNRQEKATRKAQLRQQKLAEACDAKRRVEEQRIEGQRQQERQRAECARQEEAKKKEAEVRERTKREERQRQEEAQRRTDSEQQRQKQLDLEERRRQELWESARKVLTCGSCKCSYPDYLIARCPFCEASSKQSLAAADPDWQHPQPPPLSTVTGHRHLSEEDVLQQLQRSIDASDFVGIGNLILDMLFSPLQDTTQCRSGAVLQQHVPRIVAEHFGLPLTATVGQPHRDNHLPSRLHYTWTADIFPQLVIFAFVLGATRKTLPPPHDCVVAYYVRMAEQQSAEIERVALRLPKKKKEIFTPDDL